MVSVEKVEQLPLFHRATITSDQINILEHMNVRHYLVCPVDGAQE